jgi:hypothetical protein
LIALQLVAAAYVDRQVRALVVGRQQVAMYVIDVLAALVFIDASDDISVRIKNVTHGFTSMKFYIGARYADCKFHRSMTKPVAE